MPATAAGTNIWSLRSYELVGTTSWLRISQLTTTRRCGDLLPRRASRARLRTHATSARPSLGGGWARTVAAPGDARGPHAIPRLSRRSVIPCGLHAPDHQGTPRHLRRRDRQRALRRPQSPARARGPVRAVPGPHTVSVVATQRADTLLGALETPGHS